MPSHASRLRAPAPISGEVAWATKRSFLATGAAWPEEPPPECMETHASLVFLTRDRAWKLKKPIRLQHVDQRTLEDRARLCRRELALNRELAGDVYIGLTPLVQRPDGNLALGGAGRIVDWLIEMKRLPAAAMLDHRLQDGPAPQLKEIELLADGLAAFYLRQKTPEGASRSHYRRLLRESRINAAHIRELRHEIGVPIRDDVLDYPIPAFKARRGEIARRARAGILVEGHGDLRAEHVCLVDPPVVFDRVEFNHGIRLVDPFDEFNSLGLDCALCGTGWIRGVLLMSLSRFMAPPSRALMTAYGVARFLTRARLSIDHLRDTDVRTPEKWPARARRYLSAAAALIDEFDTEFPETPSRSPPPRS